MPLAPCSQEKGFQSKMTFIFCEAEWRDQWRPTPGVSTRPMKADFWAHPPRTSIFGCGTDSDGSKKRTAILHWRTLLSYYYSSAALGTPSPPPITDDCSRPSHIEFSCGLPLATLPFSGLLIPFHAVVPVSITAFTAGTPPLLGLRSAGHSALWRMGKVCCFRYMTVAVTATATRALGRWDHSSQRPLLGLTSLPQGVPWADCADI